MSKITNPITREVVYMHNKIKKWLSENRDIWIKEVNEDIERICEKNVRVFQTYFKNPGEAIDGKFVFYALSENDVANLYPDLLKKAKKCQAGEYLYIFNCDSACENNMALRIDSYINL